MRGREDVEVAGVWNFFVAKRYRAGTRLEEPPACVDALGLVGDVILADFVHVHAVC